MVFEWDEQKEQKNISKHGIDFSLAAHVFFDENRIEYYDEMHSIDEDRYITIGLINDKITVLFVAYTERDESIRIISARMANGKERKKYYDCQKEY